MTAYFDFAETIYRRQSHAGVCSIVQKEKTDVQRENCLLEHPFFIVWIHCEI